MWLGSAILASLLLASSLTVSASSSTATASATTITRASVKPVLTASIVPQIYTEAVRKQMQSVPTSTDSVAVAVAVQTKKPTEQAAVQSVKQVAVQPAKKAVVQAVKSANVQLVKNNTKPVQVAASPKKQVSRSNSSDLVNNALSLIGDPYSYGGTSPSGFDCSGYTQYVFKGSGSSLPRTTAGQFGAG